MAREPQRPKYARVTEDTFASLIRLFMASPKWALPPPKGYAENTKTSWGGQLAFMSRPDCLGAISVQEIRPSLVQAFFDGIADRPGKQETSLAVLRQLEKWAIVRELLPRQITLGIEITKSDGGHTPWSDAHVETAEQHARGDLARAITLAAHTGQRGSDLVRMGPTDVETFDGIDGINVIQQKTKREVWIPITSTLAAAMATWERRPGPFLRRLDGGVWTRKALYTAWVYERDHNPDLAALRALGLVPHGLRGHACVRLLRAGANTRQIADMVGMSEDMVKRYTRLSAQRENASAAVYHLERTLRERETSMTDKNAG
jgi:integrase